MTRRIAWFESGIWPASFGFTQHEDVFIREVKRLFGRKLDFHASKNGARAWRLSKEGYVPTFIVCIGEQDDTSPAKIAGQLAHEATHVKRWLFKSIGETKPGAETEAYFVQWLTQRCLEAYHDGR